MVKPLIKLQGAEDANVERGNYVVDGPRKLKTV